MPRPNEVIGKGTKPIKNAIAYEMTLPDGTVEVCTIASYTLSPHGSFRAWVHHPKLGMQLMDPDQGYLSAAKPIVALTQDDIATIVEAVTKPLLERITSLELQCSDADEAITALENQIVDLQLIASPPVKEVTPVKAEPKAKSA